MMPRTQKQPQVKKGTLPSARLCKCKCKSLIRFKTHVVFCIGGNLFVLSYRTTIKCTRLKGWIASSNASTMHA